MSYPVLNGGIITIDQFKTDNEKISSDGLGNLIVTGSITVPTVDSNESSTVVANTEWVKNQGFRTKRIKEKANITVNGQSVYTFSYDSSDNVDVYLNAMLLDENTSYTCSNGNTITLSSNISTNITTADILYFILN